MSSKGCCKCASPISQREKEGESAEVSDRWRTGEPYMGGGFSIDTQLLVHRGKSAVTCIDLKLSGKGHIEDLLSLARNLAD